MKTKSIGILGAIVLAVVGMTLLAPVRAEAAEKKLHWEESYDKALEDAKAQDKPVVVLFTGSDWCGACKALDREVFDKSDFVKQVGDEFIFVKLDFPMREKQRASLVERNRKLAKDYKIEGYPTLIVLSSDGKKVLGRQVGYPGGGVDGLVAQLRGIANR